MIRSGALAAIACIALFGNVSLATAEPLPTETFKIFPAALAVEAAQAAIGSCKTQGYNVSVAIVDRAGDLKLLLVGDGAGALTRSLSRRKAYTAAMRRASSGDLAKRLLRRAHSIPRSTIDSSLLLPAPCRSRLATKRSAPLASVARRAATRTKPAPMLVLLRSVIV